MNNEIQFILYQLPDEEGRVQVVIKDETIWATQKGDGTVVWCRYPRHQQASDTYL